MESGRARATDRGSGGLGRAEGYRFEAVRKKALRTCTLDTVWSLVFCCLVWFRCSGRKKVVCGGAPLAVDRKVVPGAWHRDYERLVFARGDSIRAPDTS